MPATGAQPSPRSGRVLAGRVISAAVVALTFVSTPAIVDAFGPASDVREFAITYLRIASFGVAALLVMFAATGVLRGLQDTRTPLVVAVVANLVNIVLNVTFVYGFDWGIAGSAWGTLVAQGAAAVVMVYVVVRAARRFGAPLGPHRPGVVAAWRVGVPLIVRTLTLRAALLLATYVAATVSTPAVAAHQVAFTLWTFLAFALDAIAIAGQAITGKLLGASDAAGARAATRRMITWGVVCGVVLGLLIFVTRPLVVPLFTPDAEVQDAARRRALDRRTPPADLRRRVRARRCAHRRGRRTLPRLGRRHQPGGVRAAGAGCAVVRRWSCSTVVGVLRVHVGADAHVGMA